MNSTVNQTMQVSHEMVAGFQNYLDCVCWALWPESAKGRSRYPSFVYPENPKCNHSNKSSVLFIVDWPAGNFHMSFHINPRAYIVSNQDLQSSSPGFSFLWIFSTNSLFFRLNIILLFSSTLSLEPLLCLFLTSFKMLCHQLATHLRILKSCLGNRKKVMFIF